jgi:transcriptional regulator with XRE-family HTH domain
MGATLNPRAGWRLAQLLGSAQRIIRVKYDFSNEKFSVRKPFPITPKTIGDHLIFKRFVANLSQAEVAALLGVSNNTLSSWENDKSVPTNAQWNLLTAILPLSPELINSKPNTTSLVLGFPTAMIELVVFRAANNRDAARCWGEGNPSIYFFFFRC